MSDFFYKVFISILISSNVLYLAEVNSQTQSRDCFSSLFSNSSSKARVLYRLAVYVNIILIMHQIT